MKENFSPKESSSEIPRSNTKNGLYCEGTMDLSALTQEEETKLRKLDYKVWLHQSKTLKGPLMSLNSDEHNEYVSLLEKCGRKYIMEDSARRFYED